MMQQCSNGHLYDDTKHSSCPFCNQGGNANVTVPLSGPQGGQPIGDSFPQTAGFDQFPQTEPLDGYGTNNEFNVYQQNDPFPQTLPLGQGIGVTKALTDFPETVSGGGAEEVRGWLVCVEGEKIGADFRICGEKSKIGRGSGNDIKLEFDNTISSGANATIMYDRKTNVFYITPGESKNNIYVNNQLLMTPIQIKDYDIIEIGKTKLVFRSLCNETFSWANPLGTNKTE